MTTPIIYFRDRFPPHGKRLETFPETLSYSFQHMKPGVANFSLPLSGPDSLLPDGAAYMGKGAMVSIERPDGLLSWVGFVTRLEISKADNRIDYIAKDHAGALFARAACLRGDERQGSAGDLLAAAFREADSRGAPPLLCELDLQAGGTWVSWTPDNRTMLDALNRLAAAANREWALRYEAETTVRTRLIWRERVGSDYSGSVCYEDGVHVETMSYLQDIEGDLEATIAVGGSGAYKDRLAVMTSRSGLGGAGASEVRKLTGTSHIGVATSGLGGTLVRQLPEVSGSEALAAAGSYAIERPPEALGDQLSLTLVESEIDMSRLGVGNWCMVTSPDIALGKPLSRLVRMLALQLGSEGKVETEVQVVA